VSRSKPAIDDLADYIASQSTIKASTRNALRVKLDATLAALAVPDASLACQAMLDFINLVKAQRAKHITAAQADYITAQASDIRLLMGCR